MANQPPLPNMFFSLRKNIQQVSSGVRDGGILPILTGKTLCKGCVNNRIFGFFLGPTVTNFSNDSKELPQTERDKILEKGSGGVLL